MTSAIIKYPICMISKKYQKHFLQEDPRKPGSFKGKTIRCRYLHGSKSAAVTFLENGSVMRVSMSLFRAISGQNAMTLPNQKRAVALAFQAISKKIQQEFRGELVTLDSQRDIELLMVDLVRHYKVGTHSDVQYVLKALSKCIERSGRWVCKPVKRGTIYETVEIEMPKMGIKVKFYNKYAELQQQGRRLPKKIVDREQLLTTMKGVVRMEITLTSKALKERGLNVLNNWNNDERKKVFDDVFRELDLKGKFRVLGNQDVFRNLPKRLQLTYLRWQSGHDLYDMKRSTKARHRKELLEKHGIDIEHGPSTCPLNYRSLRSQFSADRIVSPDASDIAKWIPEWPAKGGKAVGNSFRRYYAGSAQQS